jgi:acetyltransferase-like isoleucine patch superfamily enzyme
VKPVAKQLFRSVCIIATSPLWLVERLCKMLSGKDEVLFATHLELLSMIPGKTGSYLRTAYLTMTLAEPVRDCMILFGTVFTHADAVVRPRVYIGLRCCIGTASIGEDTMLSDYVQVLSGRRQHGTELHGTFQQQEQRRERVSIGRNCWIGAGTVIMADVGDNTVIGAGSIIVHPIPANCVAVGSPARVVRSFDAVKAATEKSST